MSRDAARFSFDSRRGLQLTTSDPPIKTLTVTYQGVAFTIAVYQAVVGYAATWAADGKSGQAGYMPTIEGAITLAKFRIQEHLKNAEPLE
jgi:hypothetical protein